MPPLKTIQINPELLKVSSSKTKKNLKTERKKKKEKIIQPNTLKKALLRKIKDKANQDKNQKLSSDTKQTKEEAFSSDFEKHLNYLSDLSNQHKHKKKKKNKTLKTYSHENPNIVVNTELPPELKLTNQLKINSNQKQNNSIPILNKTDPPYSSLKGGSKPTFREWKQLTQKNIDKNELDISDLKNKKTPVLAENSELNEINKLKTRILENNKKHENIPTPKILKKKTIKRKYKFGKSNGKISVLVKNTKTRKIVQNELDLLKEAPIKEIKEYLRKRYLYKSGSNAPNDVLRRTYIDSHLSGEITNKSTENLIHNFINP